MTRVLLISLSLPPFRESQTIRSAYIVQAASQCGVEFGLVSAEVPENLADATLNELLPPDIPFWRTAPPTYTRIYARLNRLRWGKGIGYLYGNLAYRLLVPDVYAGWQKQAYTLAHKAIEEFRPDILMSASGSCTAHIACAMLARTARIPWIADLGDPWSWVDWQHKDTWLKAVFNSCLERRVLQHANLLVLTTHQTANAYKKKGFHNTLVVPYGYRSVDFPTESVRTHTPPITLTYVGAASRRARNLIPLITSLDKKVASADYHLQIVGPVSKYFREEATRSGLHNCLFTGAVSYQESLDYIKNASILILVGNRSPYQVPGKTFLYLASGRPILYLAQMNEDEDPTYEVLRYFPGVRHVPNDEKEIGDFWRSLSWEDFVQWEKDAQKHPSMPELHQYRIEKAVEPLVQSLSDAKGGIHALCAR